MTKDFENWNKLKTTLHYQPDNKLFQERDIWWCSIGVNIGHEEDGKNELYNRPVLIIKKFNKRLFWGIPLTTRTKNSPHYHLFEHSGKKQSAMLTQMRLFDASRLNTRMGKLPKKTFKDISNKIIDYLK